MNREKIKRTAQRIPANEQLYRRESGDFVLAGVNENAVLACVVNHQAKIGMTLLEVNRCTWRLPVMIRKWMRSNRGAVLELRKAIEPIRSRNFLGARNAMEPDRGVPARVFVENRIRPPGGVQVGR